MEDQGEETAVASCMQVLALLVSSVVYYMKWVIQKARVQALKMDHFISFVVSVSGMSSWNNIFMNIYGIFGMHSIGGKINCGVVVAFKCST